MLQICHTELKWTLFFFTYGFLQMHSCKRWVHVDPHTHSHGSYRPFLYWLNLGRSSTTTRQDLSLGRPAAVLLINSYVSVSVQSYRSEGSQALCLVSPWERLHSVQLYEKRNTDSTGWTTRAWIPPLCTGKIQNQNTATRRLLAIQGLEGIQRK